MPAIPCLGEIELVAVCDLKLELAQRNARNFGAPAVYTDAAQMLAQEAPDAAMVVGPPQMHEEVGLQVLAAGAHLFIEKPAAPTIAGAKRLVEAAEAAGKLGQVGHMMRHADPLRVAWDSATVRRSGRSCPWRAATPPGPPGPSLPDMAGVSRTKAGPTCWYRAVIPSI
jgi:predicted dehydrogenase